jgi:hypothetical protein
MVVDVGSGPLDDEDEKILRGLKATADEMGLGFQLGEIRACEKCNLLGCACDIIAAHEPGCQYRFAATCAIPISCEPHGRDVCVECDPCSCVVVKK